MSIMSGTLKAPTLGEIEAIALAAFDRLPETFRRLASNVPIRVDDFPADEVLDEMDAESPFDILGLYTGTALTVKSVSDVVQQPDLIHLYRRPILDYWSEHDETLEDVITHVLIHEIGHHFGLSDEDMEALEAKAGG